MPRPVRFKVKKWGSLWLVTGRVSIGDSIGVESYQASFTSAKAADKEAARMAQIEEENRARIHAERAARKERAAKAREARARRKLAMGVQIEMFP